MKALGTYLEFSGVRGIGLHRIIHRRNLLERALTMEIDRPFQRTFGGPTIRSPCLTSHISGINKTTDPSSRTTHIPRFPRNQLHSCALTSETIPHLQISVTMVSGDFSSDFHFSSIV
jgi:hypothetical protein